MEKESKKQEDKKQKLEHKPQKLSSESKECLETREKQSFSVSQKSSISEKSKTFQKEKKSDKEIIAELTDTLQRTQAEFENYRKRVDKEKGEFVKYSKAELIQKLLPTIDTFEIALKNISDKEKFVKGMEMVYVQLFSTLKAEGLKPIEALNKKFDPYLHEVMLKEKSSKEDEVVLEELQKGYMLNDKVLRHSKVKISEKVKEENKK